MDRALVLESPAKINLYLAVLGRRPDGYHDIDTVFQTVSLADRVSVALAGSGIEVTTDDPALPVGEANLAGRAARALLDAAGMGGAGVRIHVAKRIPVGAGLGGGSGDAATVLVALDRLLGLGWGSARLEALGATIGSDVPFLIRGGTARGEGRGERLTRLPPIPQVEFLLAKPAISISTAWAYDMLGEGLTPKADPPRVVDWRSQGTINRLGESLWNAFEGPVFARYPEVRWLRDEMLSRGAVAAGMSGSGSAVYGVYTEKEKLRDSESSLKSRAYWCASAVPTGERVA